ncbi:MAG: translocation/assembly module TamB [bacterium]|nr:translocation/assembly module TamB [bacterium]
MKEKIPKSVIIIWLITAIAIFLSVISLIGVIISRSEKIKKNMLEKIREYGFYIQDFSFDLFPASDGFYAYLKSVTSDNFSFDSLTFSPRKISVENLRIGFLSCTYCELFPGIRTFLKARELSILIKSEGGGKIDLTPVCKVKSLSRYKFLTSFIPLSLVFDFYESSIYVDDVHILFRKGRSEVSLRNLNVISDYSLDVGENRVTGNIQLTFDPIFLQGIGELRLGSPVDASGRYNISFCDGSQLDIAYSLDFKTDLNFLSEKIGNKISSDSTFSAFGNFSILENGDIKTSGDLRGNLKNLSFSDQNFGNFILDFSFNYDSDGLKFSGRTQSEYISELLVEGIYSNSKSKGNQWNINFTGKFDLGNIPFVDRIYGKIFASGNLSLPKINLKSNLNISNFSYDTIRFNSAQGNIRWSGRNNIDFVFNINNIGANVNWKGKFDANKIRLKSQASFLGSSLMNLLGILNVSLPIDGTADGNISIDLLKDNVIVLGNVVSYRNFAFGEKIACVSSDIFANVNLKNGEISVSVKGVGAERESFCASKLPQSYDNSMVYFDLSLDSETFGISISGIYDLSYFDMLNIPLRGKAKFDGLVSGNLKGKTNINGQIGLESSDVEFVQYPISSSCIYGKILISDEAVRFEGESCEGFSISSSYSLNKSDLFVSISKGETFVNIMNGDISGKGRLEDISKVIRNLGDNIGQFDFSYNLERKDGRVLVKSQRFSLENLTFENLDFSGDIKDNTMSFSVSGLYSGDKFWGSGNYSIASGKIHSNFYLQNFAGIPLDGSLLVSGSIDKPYISGNFRVKNIELSDDKIEILFEREQGGRVDEEVVQKERTTGTLNIKIDLQEIIYRGPFMNLNLDGVLYVVGNLDDPTIFGIFDIKDGTFSLADTEFSKIRGVAFLRGKSIFINISASTDVITFEGDKYLVQLRMIGDLKSPKVYLFSTPQVSQADIVCILAMYRRCDSLDEFNKIMSSLIYRNFSLISRSILESIGAGTDLKVIISPTDIGLSRKIGQFDIIVMQNIFEDVRRFIASRTFGENYQFIFSWDSKRYGYSMLGDIGNVGVDVKTKRRF